MARSGSALVVGGGNGIGRAIAHRLAADGHSVGIADLNGTAADEVADELRVNGARSVALQVDATDPAALPDAVDAIERELGPLSDAVLSVFHNYRAPLAEWDAARWQRVVDIGLNAGFLLARSVIPGMAERGRGSLVFVSSIQAGFGFPSEPAYGAAKAGLESLMRQLAVEHGPSGVRVNCVAPALVLVERNKERWADPAVLDAHRARFPLRRAGRPEDVAAAAAFLLSDDAEFITGVTLPVDGGMSVRPPSLGDDVQLAARNDPQEGQR